MNSLREAQYQRLVREAYNEGFSEGMWESTSSEGGKRWSESISIEKLNLLARTPQESSR